MADNAADNPAPASRTHSVSLAIRNTTTGEAAFPAYTFASKEEADRFSEWASAKGFDPRPGRYFTSAQEAMRHAASISDAYWS
ncbi:hypothetical protein [uncultured Salinicola sp.]|uniref:hypothetical protein n=1 Tax=uncultured Salinicola sp. TaxID=1193542 RepID=UPI00261969D4|nr:hypothetical protein [uncultured Salinicola sp.]|tara:strand:+ start:73 stop:321 length:249 start_codon:yes stop_codon:yes gene_type:complete